jgi:NAD+---dinitrogen-reductase ADP-D-ribosyltransferase
MLHETVTSSATDSLPSLANRCSLPPWAIASREFQGNPWPIEIVGVRQSEPRLFSQLDNEPDAKERGRYFHEYISQRFQLNEWVEHPGSQREMAMHSYLRFLRGWGADSNNRSGAVLKAWVESRFGLKATYHQGILANSPEAQAQYAQDRMRGESVTMGVNQQLDLLYTFCQYELERRFPGERWLTLYRGTHDPEEYAVRGVEVKPKGREMLVELNNLSSFTSNREIAWEFGSSVWQAQVPISKIVFFSGLLPRHLLEGEKEHLVLGGEYLVKKLVC